MAGEKGGAVDRADLLSYLALQDTIRWQGPTLALAAQAFLLTIATAEKGTTFTRAVAASLGLVTALAAFDLVIRKTLQVGSIKRELDQSKLFSPNLLRPAIPPSLLWLLALGLFALADLAILTMVTFGSPWGAAALPDGKKSSLLGWLALEISIVALISILMVLHLVWPSFKSSPIAMPKVFGLHEIELRPGVKPEEFERIFAEKIAPSPEFPGWKTHVLRGDRGARTGKYLVLFEIESLKARNQYFPRQDEPSEEVDQFFEQHKKAEAAMKELERYSTFGENDITTDYVAVT
jgi:hypothetical protein